MIDADNESLAAPARASTSLIALLREDGRMVIGPTVADAAIVYAEVDAGGDLPNGIVDEQAPGHYRLHAAPDGSSHAVLRFRLVADLLEVVHLPRACPSA